MYASRRNRVIISVTAYITACAVGGGGKLWDHCSVSVSQRANTFCSLRAGKSYVLIFVTYL